MESTYRSVLQIPEKHQVNNCIYKYDQTMLIFLNKLCQVFHSFFKSWRLYHR